MILGMPHKCDTTTSGAKWRYVKEVNDRERTKRRAGGVLSNGGLMRLGDFVTARVLLMPLPGTGDHGIKFRISRNPSKFLSNFL
jgi:hypothetical protein